MNALYNFKQLKKSLNEYVEKTKKIQRIFFKKIQNQMLYKMISRLNDDMTKKIVKKIIAQKENSTYDFEIIVKLIKSIIENQNKKNSIAKLQRKMNSKNRMFAIILNQNNKVISIFTRQFVDFNVSTSFRERQFEKQKNVENVFVFYRNDAFNQKKQKYNQKNQNQNNQNRNNQQEYQSQKYEKQQNKNFKKNSQHFLYYAFATASFATSFNNVNSFICYNCEKIEHFFKQCSHFQAFKKDKNRLFRKDKKRKRSTTQQTSFSKKFRTTKIFMIEHDCYSTNIHDISE